jgi:hypothetical protein
VIPEPYVFALLALIASRVWKLIGDDRILDRPRDWVLERIKDDERAVYWGDFIVCPWCAGFWVSGIVYGFWMATLGKLPDNVEDVLVGIGVWLAISCLVGLFGMTVERLKEEPS